MMKRFLMVAAGAAIMAMTFATSAMAGWLSTATGWSGQSGGNGTIMSGDATNTGAVSAGNSWVTTQTSPPAVAAGSDLQQQTGGSGVGVSSLTGQLGQGGQTGAAANDQVTGSSVLGNAQLNGQAGGQHTIVIGGMNAASNQGSIAIDTLYGGGNGSYAQQQISTGVVAIASSGKNGPSGAGTDVATSTTSTVAAGGNN